MDRIRLISTHLSRRLPCSGWVNAYRLLSTQV